MEYVQELDTTQKRYSGCSHSTPYGLLQSIQFSMNNDAFASNLVDGRRIELLHPVCKTSVLPLSLTAQSISPTKNPPGASRLLAGLVLVLMCLHHGTRPQGALSCSGRTAMVRTITGAASCIISCRFANIVLTSFQLKNIESCSIHLHYTHIHCRSNNKF